MFKRFIVMLCLLLIVVRVMAQDISPELQDQIDALETFTIQTRDLESLQPVTRLFPTKAEAVEEMTRLVLAEIPPEEAERLAAFYVAFDFMPPGTDYVGAYLEALEAQIGGFYDPLSKEMNTLLINGGELGDKLPLLEQITYVHEFTHALQDQHFDLNALDLLTRDNPDQAQAVRALIEGDATLVMNVYTQAISAKNPLGTTLQLLAQGFQARALSLPPGLPEIVSSELLTAYTSGAAFVAVVQAQGGWEAVDAAFQPEHLPQSMEQILHPDKYLAGEGPLPVTLTDPALDPEWETIWDTTFGEFYLREYLKTQLRNQPAALAAAGWGGDHYQVYRHTESGQLAWLLRIEWDSARDAEEFTDAYVDFLGDRFPGVVAVDSCWSTATEALCFADTATAHVLAFAPTLGMAQHLIDGQG